RMSSFIVPPRIVPRRCRHRQSSIGHRRRPRGLRFRATPIWGRDGNFQSRRRHAALATNVDRTRCAHGNERCSRSARTREKDMPQAQWSDKRERQYEHIKQGLKKRGRKNDVAEEIAARTVNKERARHGEAK